MPLPAHGVLIGTFDHFARDNPNSFGSWYHGKVYVRAPAGLYEAAVDVSTPQGIHVQYRTTGISPAEFANVSALADGYHPLAATATSGAIDYVRSGMLQLRRRPRVTVADLLRALRRLPQRLVALLFKGPRWILSNGDNALNELEQDLAGARRVYVFGAPYTTGLGMHDVHMNQGDPPGQFQHLDGIWQDGAVIIDRPSGLTAFLVKFETQSFHTDDHGLPLP